MKRVGSIVGLLIFSLYAYKVIIDFTYDFSLKGDYKYGEPIVSPSGEYTAQMYFDNYGGAAGGVNFIVNIIANKEEAKEQTIYYSDAKGGNSIYWTSDNTLEIQNKDATQNRSVELLVGKEIYDENGGACRTRKIKKQFTCYREETYKGIRE